MIPPQVTGPDPATVAWMSNAQSGSVNWTCPRAPGAGAVPSGFHSLVPVRRIDSADKAHAWFADDAVARHWPEQIHADELQSPALLRDIEAARAALLQTLDLSELL